MNRRDFFKFLPLAAAVGAVAKVMQPKCQPNPQYQSVRGLGVKYYTFDLEGRPVCIVDPELGWGSERVAYERSAYQLDEVGRWRWITSEDFGA